MPSNPLSAEDLSTLQGRYNMASLRQLVKAHNRFNDLVLPKKLKKDQLIKRIYKEGFKLTKTGKSFKLVQSREAALRATYPMSLTLAKTMKNKKYPNNRSGY